MNYYVIQVLTRSEEKFIRLADSLLFGKGPGSLSVAGPGSTADAGSGTAGRVLRVELEQDPGWNESRDRRDDEGRREGSTDRGRHTRPDPRTDFIELPEGFSEEALPGRLVWPRRNLTIRRKGVEQKSLAPIFPGYVFYEAEEVHPQVYWVLKRLSGFVKFLKDENRLQSLSGQDRELLVHFLSYGEIVDKSVVYFDRDRRIRVKSGPMKGLEGRIVKVDKRKKRAKIRLSMYSDRFLVDFGFELLEPAEGNERQAD